MANTKNGKNNKSNSAKNSKNLDTNTFIMKTLVVLGVIMLFFAIVYLMYYFFVKKNDIGVNMSTDKELVYIVVKGEQELITTQKYVSDLDYSMRYDINNFTVFKYKGQDIFKLIDAEKTLVVVEHSDIPSSCSNGVSDLGYNSCVMTLDDFTEVHYISTKGKTYKITLKKPTSDDYEAGVKSRIQYMLDSFEVK